MIRFKTLLVLPMALLIIGMATSINAEVPQIINYQGRLTNTDGTPVDDDTYPIRFKIYGSEAGDDSLWSSGPQSVQVTSGLFEYRLGFAVTLPDDLFSTGINRWLGIIVGTNSEISPRTAFTSSAFSYQALRSDTTDYAKDIADLCVTQEKIADNAIHSAHIQDHSITFDDIGQNSASLNQVMKWNGTAWAAATDETASGSAAWTRAGNIVSLNNSTDSVGIGTASPAAKLEVSGDVLITGKAKIGDGNTNTGLSAFVAGSNNHATGNFTTVSGGANNVVVGIVGTIGGGSSNAASGTQSTVSGGGNNQANGNYSTVPGGSYNNADSAYTFAAGRRAKAVHKGAFVWADTTDADFSSTGDNQFLIRAGGGVGINTDSPGAALHVGGTAGVDGIMFPDGTLQTTASSGSPGSNWTVTDSVLYTNNYWGLARGGAGNTLYGDSSHTHVNLGVACTTGTSGADFYYATISGGWRNKADSTYATVGGGVYNWATGVGSIISGGVGNEASGRYSTIAGGRVNMARGEFATVAGGGGASVADSNSAAGDYSFVGGGTGNKAANEACTVGGGSGNTASSNSSTVSGGVGNTTSGPGSTIGGGSSNAASGTQSTVSGGGNNQANGNYSTVPGGRSNIADSAYSFAAGRRAKAIHKGAFVWADTTDADFFSTGDNQFLIRAGGGVGINTDSPGAALHVGGTAGVDGIMFPDGTLQTTASSGSPGSNWTVTDSVLHTNNYWGLARGGAGNTLYGDSSHTHVNLGVACTTGTSGADFYYATVSGGYRNRADSIYATVGGGHNNIARGQKSTVGGGESNAAGRRYATIGGGVDNSASYKATVGGGESNEASGNHSTVGGGYDNAATSASTSTVGGGYRNTASGSASTVGGGYRNEASGNFSTVPGGRSDTAQAVYGGVASGYSNRAGDRDSDTAAFIGGGYDNSATAKFATVGGGYFNEANGNYSTVPGGSYNNADSAYTFAAGRRAKAVHKGAFVWADTTDADFSSTGDNQFLIRAGGGVGINTDSPGAALHVGGTAGVDGIMFPDGTLQTTASSGGSNWTVTDSVLFTNNYWGLARGGAGNKLWGNYAHTMVDLGNACTTGTSGYNYYFVTVGGGYRNTASGDYSTVGGGQHNTAGVNSASVGGGDGNSASGVSSVVSGGLDNLASGNYSTVGGGDHNIASGSYATVPGGYYSTAGGNNSFATGYRAKANHDGSIVIAANSSTTTSDSIRSGGDEQMVLQADGGIYITNTSELAPYNSSRIITTRGGAYLSGNGTAWTNSSDKNKKENFEPVDGQKILDLLEQLEITQWNYKEDDDSITHIGPVAQDFYALFELGGDDLSISTVDPAGVAFAAIKGLNEKSKRIDALETELAELRILVEKLISNQE